MYSLVFLICSVAFALIISFICSLLEAALLSISSSQIAEIRQKNSAKGHLVKSLKENLARPLAVILISNTAAHTIGAAVAGAQFGELYGNRWLGAFSLVFTLAMVQYTEILPKNLGVRFSRQLMAMAARPLQIGGVILYPVIKLAYLFNRPFEVKSDEEPADTADEISALAGEARSEQLINQKQERIIKATPLLSERTAVDIMLPVENISFLDSNKMLDESIQLAHEDFHTRYPVCKDGNRDDVLGYVNFKEMVAVNRNNGGQRSLKSIIRPLEFVTPDDTAALLLERFATQHIHMSIVRDEAGKTLGMVTMEDIVEELVGELDDEFDSLPRIFYSPNDDFWVVGGGNSMSMLAREMHHDLPRRSEPLALWFAREVDARPRVGDVFKFRDTEFTVRKVRRGRVLEFNVRRNIAPATETELSGEVN